MSREPILLPESDVRRILSRVEDAVWNQAEEQGLTEDEGLEISAFLVEEIEAILTREL